MKSLFPVCALAGLSVVFAASSVAQEAAAAHHYNPRTHTVEANVASHPITDATTARAYGGVLKFEFAVKLATPVRSGEQLVCSADAFESGAGLDSYEESGASVGAVSGSTASCSVVIPYSWLLSTPGSDIIELNYTVEILPTSTTNLGAFTLTRSSTHTLGTIAVPGNGALTVENISATL